MTKTYKTARLPLNFIIAGSLFLAIGIWQIAVRDYLALLFLIPGMAAISTIFGVKIDYRLKRMKIFFSVFFIKFGKWENINTIKKIILKKKTMSRRMNVLSVGSAQSTEVYYLYFITDDSEIEIMSGNEEYIKKATQEISENLNITNPFHLQ